MKNNLIAASVLAAMLFGLCPLRGAESQTVQKNFYVYVKDNEELIGKVKKSYSNYAELAIMDKKSPQITLLLDPSSHVKSIAEELEKVFIEIVKESGQTVKDQKKQLKISVVTYSRDALKECGKPSSDEAEIKKAFAKALEKPNDDLKATHGAVGALIKALPKDSRLMLVTAINGAVESDELEDTVAALQKKDIILDVISGMSAFQGHGPSISFTRKFGKDLPKNARFRTDSNPFPEGVNDSYALHWDENHSIPSGVGYWGLGRMVSATDGKYYFGRFDSKDDDKKVVTRNYDLNQDRIGELLPYYGARKDYFKEYKKNKLVQAVVDSMKNTDDFAQVHGYEFGNMNFENNGNSEYSPSMYALYNPTNPNFQVDKKIPDMIAKDIEHLEKEIKDAEKDVADGKLPKRWIAAAELQRIRLLALQFQIMNWACVRDVHIQGERNYLTQLRYPLTSLDSHSGAALLVSEKVDAKDVKIPKTLRSVDGKGELGMEQHEKDGDTVKTTFTGMMGYRMYHLVKPEEYDKALVDLKKEVKDFQKKYEGTPYAWNLEHVYSVSYMAYHYEPVDPKDVKTNPNVNINTPQPPGSVGGPNINVQPPSGPPSSGK